MAKLQLLTVTTPLPLPHRLSKQESEQSSTCCTHYSVKSWKPRKYHKTGNMATRSGYERDAKTGEASHCLVSLRRSLIESSWSD
jgi:hypothetical protein